MIVQVNGRKENLKKNIRLDDLVKNKGLDIQKIVVEHNLKIVKKDVLSEVILSENDNVEIVSFVGGG